MDTTFSLKLPMTVSNRLCGQLRETSYGRWSYGVQTPTGAHNWLRLEDEMVASARNQPGGKENISGPKRRKHHLTSTSMSDPRRLPQEVCDHIIDLSYDDAETLKRCCLVSKSWVPRTRKHHFFHVALDSVNYRKWQKTFPDPANSPACYTLILKVDGFLKVADWGDWIQGFSHVERLIVTHPGVGNPYEPIFLLPYHRLAPSLKSLYVNMDFLPLSQTFNLIRSLPLLEDVSLRAQFIGNELHGQQNFTGSPALTGTLNIWMLGFLGDVLRSLLDLSGGLRFREVELLCYDQIDLTLVTELVVACSDTLERFDIESDIYGGFILSPCSISHLPGTSGRLRGRLS